MTIDIVKDSVVYVLCPAYFKTGGTELLHQYVNVLVNSGKVKCKMVYPDATQDKNINPAFEKYINEYCELKDVADNKNNVLIVPEVMTDYLKCFQNVKKVIWWESVDNYLSRSSVFFNIKNFKSNPKNSLRFIKNIILKKKNGVSKKYLKKVDYHFVQSFYAKAFLSDLGINNNVFYVSDYLNDTYLDAIDCFDKNVKENYVCYNPLKGKRDTNKIIRKMKDVKFVKLINMRNEQVKDSLLHSKLYIDFGNHPGKDRFPREAASMGCCIITNKKGSAKYKEDVFIPDEFKFKSINKELPLIKKTIIKCLNDYDNECIKFEEYRKRIKAEKEMFVNNVVNCYSLKD